MQLFYHKDQEKLWAMRAKHRHILLTKQHLQALRIFNNLYQQEKKIPKTRIFMDALKEYDQTILSSDLQRLFGVSPLNAVQKILGIYTADRCD